MIADVIGVELKLVLELCVDDAEQVRERGGREKSKECKHEVSIPTALLASDILSSASLPKYFLKVGWS